MRWFNLVPELNGFLSLTPGLPVNKIMEKENTDNFMEST